jgi:hypothetical protein
MEIGKTARHSVPRNLQNAKKYATNGAPSRAGRLMLNCFIVKGVAQGEGAQ